MTLFNLGPAQTVFWTESMSLALTFSFYPSPQTAPALSIGQPCQLHSAIWNKLFLLPQVTVFISSVMLHGNAFGDQFRVFLSEIKLGVRNTSPWTHVFLALGLTSPNMSVRDQPVSKGLAFLQSRNRRLALKKGLLNHRYFKSSQGVVQYAYEFIKCRRICGFKAMVRVANTSNWCAYITVLENPLPRPTCLCICWGYHSDSSAWSLSKSQSQVLRLGWVL